MSIEFSQVQPGKFTLADNFTSLHAVSEWAAANGGEAAVHALQAEGRVSNYSRPIAQAWIDALEKTRSDELAKACVRAGERAARYAMWSAPASLVSTAVAVAAILYCQR